MTRVSHLFKNLFTVNPIIVKEIRSRMRGPRAFITLTVILLAMGGVMYAMLQLILASARYTNVLSPQVGQSLFAALAFLELFMICTITPAVTAGAISGEKEKQTYEMLMATPLSATSILWGKLISALSYVLLLLFAGIPLASVVFIFGGVAPRDMLKALVVLIGIAAAYGILGLFMSALFGRTGRATVASFITVAVLMVGPLFLAGIVGVIRSSEPPRWILAPSPISALSAALAGSMVPGAGGEIFYVLSGLFNMGVAPISQNGIPRPLYHYTLPFYAILSVVLYLLTTRLVQPARRWRMRRKELLGGLALLFVSVGLVALAYFLTASRYEKAGNPAPDTMPTIGPAMPVQAVPVQKQIEMAPLETPTPVATETPATNGNAAMVDEDTQSEIYAAIARQFYTIDHTFGDNPPNWAGLYLVTQTNDSVGDPNVVKADPVVLSKAVLSGTAKRLNDLSAKVMWIESSDAVSKDPKSGAVDNGQAAVITFGNIHLQEDGTAHVSASLYFSSLGATGKTYILTQKDGVWTISGTIGVEWIS